MGSTGEIGEIGPDGDVGPKVHKFVFKKPRHLLVFILLRVKMDQME